MTETPILIDVSRLIWRQWSGRLPTGIDRVCLAYLEHFAPRARAVVQFRRFRRIIDGSSSARLFDLLLDRTGGSFRARLVRILAGAHFRSEGANAGQIYLNVGHTGLNSPFLGPLLAAHNLHPVFLIHDLIPITHPQYCREGEAARHEQRVENALRAASGLIVNSGATERELTQFAKDRDLSVPPILVAWLGVDQQPAQAKANPTRGDRPYFVLLGTIEARKNHLIILRVWADLVGRLGDEAPQLLIIGQRGWEAEAATEILDQLGPLEGHVRELPSCGDREMRELIAGAQALLMPSFVEGFGLPVVEALQLGAPVIASDLPVFREIVGNIPTYLDPHDRKAWAQAIIDYSADGPERQRQLGAIEGFEAPIWAEHFERVEAFLDRL